MMKTRTNKRWLLCFMMFVLVGVMESAMGVHATTVQETAQATAQAFMDGNVSRTIRKANKDITLEIQYGIGGIAFEDNPLQVQVTLKGKKDFSGSLRLMSLGTYNGQRGAIGKDISIAKDTEKTFTFVLDNAEGETSYFIDLLDENEELIYSESDMVYTKWAGECGYIAILSDDFGGLTYFDGLRVGKSTDETSTSILELKDTDFPKKASVIKALKYIIIDNYDTGKLTQQQYDVLKQWVTDGGTLVLPLGANAKNVLQCFSDDFLSGSVQELKKKKVAFSLSEEQLTGSMATEVDTEKEDAAQIVVDAVDVVEFEMPGAEELSGFSDGKTAYVKKIGNGRVIVLAYDFAMEPIVGDAQKSEIAQAFIDATYIQDTRGYRGIYYDDSGDSIAKKMNDSPKPSALLFGLVFLCYIIFVGPVLYLVLKKLNKRECIWYAVPVTSLLFTLIIFGLSSIYRVRKPMVNSFAVLSLEQDIQSEKVYVNLTCPKAKDYSFTLEDEYRDISMRYSYANYNFMGIMREVNDEKSYSYMIKETNEGTEFMTHNTASFEERNFVLNRVSNNDIGMLEHNITCYTDGFDGQLTNNTIYDLTNVVVYFDNRFCIIPELKKGESVTLDKAQLVDAKAYDCFRDLEKTNYRDYSLASGMEQMYIDKSSFGKGYIWGNVGSYLPNIFKNDKVKQYGGAVVFQQFTGDYVDVVGYHPDIKTEIVSVDGDYDRDEAYVYGDFATITYNFEDMRGVEELVHEDYEKASAGLVDNDYYIADVYAYNAEIGDYEQIFTDSDTLSGKDLEKYIQGNILMLRYKTKMGYSNRIPRISVKEEQ
ncbi:MAG: hypothetical protein Q4D51_08770 [Eubacteriales bacterium]|nr:hypothetical protein [Eubacteriales bacterium]